MNYIGIDPGKSGGIAVIGPSGAKAFKMPESDADLLDLLSSICPLGSPRFALLEKVHAMPGQGVTSTFTFGEGFGKLQMALCAAKIPYQFITPAKWQKFLGCMTKGDKNVSKAAAQRLFPDIKVTHAIADALLIAEYNRRTYL
jgi:crossover junction endodeoxyribonuclease RuvC